MGRTKQTSKAEGRLPLAQRLHFDIDIYLNRLVAPSQLHRFPYPVARFLGYRKKPQPDIGNVFIAFWACVGSIAGILVIGAIFKYGGAIKDLNPPVLFASFGATAVLEYNVIHSPLAAPRNALLGHGLSVVVGVGISKLFQLSSDFMNLRWVGAGIACGASSLVMTMTNTVHPPGGATAVLAVIEPSVVELGWWFVPLILLGSVLMLAVGLVTNNIQRQFPAYWWTPKDVKRRRQADVEVGVSDPERLENTETKQAVLSADFATNDFLVMGPAGYVLPHGVTLSVDEEKVMTSIQERLRARLEARDSSDTEVSDVFSDKDDKSVKDDHSMASS